MTTERVRMARGPVVLDVQGPRLTDDDRRRLLDPSTGAVILFARHFENRAQLLDLTREIRSLRRPRLLVGVDHEGGRVQRFKSDGFTLLPAMRSVGALWHQDRMQAMSLATSIGVVMAGELRACGVDFSFAPVLDLDFDVCPAIGTRAFERDPVIVTLLARALIQGMSVMGMASCGKHFPGHGAVSADSHFETPVDSRPLEEIMAQDVAPYRWLTDAVLPSVMPAHVIYSQVDDRPAGFSRKWIREILRGELGYDGLVFSDDLTMEGAGVGGDIVERARLALDAGCDMVLVCNRPDLADQVLAGLAHTCDVQTQQRIRRLKPRGKAMSWQDLMEFAVYQKARQQVCHFHDAQ